ncbi:MAG: hypothetical protein AAFR61_20920 [Bacteroidota bacterium]
MKTIKAYRQINEALQALDNGGRFYNLFTKADDGEITAAELGKVAGVFSDRQKMVLFLEMALSEFDAQQTEAVISKLDEQLQEAYHTYQPSTMKPAQAMQEAAASTYAILEGTPYHTESKSDFGGFIMVPISTGDVTTFTMIPIIDAYDVYDMKTEGDSDSVVIAHAKTNKKLPQVPMKIGGIFKEMKADKKGEGPANIFLEGIYRLA